MDALPWMTGWETALLGALLTSLAPPLAGAQPRLERLSIPHMELCNLQYVLPLVGLVSLDMDVHWLTNNQEDVAGFYGALVTSPLPALRHVRLLHGDHFSNVQPPSRLLSVIPAFVAGYAEQLRSLEFDHVGEEIDVVTNPPPASAAEAMTAALLSCRQLRRLRVTDWWLSPSAPAPATPALPHLESLTVDVVKGLDSTAVLLVHCPHLQELVLYSSPLPYDVLVWAGERCTQLQTLTVLDGRAGTPNRYPCRLTPARFVPSHSPPRLPLLSTLNLNVDALPDDTRTLSFAPLISYLVHNAPALRALEMTQQDWLEQERPLLASLRPLSELRWLSLGQLNWMEGSLSRYWLEGMAKGSCVQRGVPYAWVPVWELQALPRLGAAWRGRREIMDSSRLRAGAWLEEEMHGQKRVFAEPGARAFFDAIAPLHSPFHPCSAPSSVSYSHKRRREE